MSSSDPDKLNEFAWNVHSYTNEYIRFADTKAELVIGWTSAIVGALLATDFEKHFALSIPGTICFAGFLLLLASFACGFWTVLPRLWTTQKLGFIFWDNIRAHKSKEAFVADLRQLSVDELNGHVIEHLHDLSLVCAAKLKWVKFSIWFAFTGSVVSGFMYLVMS